ncbi:hypothetical protein [Lysobacter sp. cf310]|uniref:hypothetical protein n=1 Tax=Lysobacter sp. cf310 TaxID=1761790 RepID=UPI0011135ED6|nr:hypothetical protein [Lysobacter sp. cf310]
MANEVSPIIIERINHESLGDQRRPAPLLVNALDKRELVPDKNEAAQEAIAAIFRQKDDEKQPKIEDLISSAISQDPQLRTALAWESRASHAAAKTINNVYRVSGFEHSTDVKESAAFQKVLAKIAIEAAGCKNAKQDPAGALDDGLADLFQDEMRSNVHSTLYQEAVNAAVPNPPLSRAPVLTDDSRIALNTTLHLERQPLTGQNIERGLVTDVNTDEALNHLGLANRGKLLQEELTYNSGLFAAAARVATKGSPELEVIQQRLEFAKEHKDELLARSKIVIIEVGADCDHAQRKDRTVRFLLGAEIPADLSTFIYGPTNRSLRSESLREFGPWEVEAGSRFHLLVSLNRFAVQQTWLRNADLLIRYRLRKPLVDQLLYWYSMHSTRPGIINIT